MRTDSPAPPLPDPRPDPPQDPPDIDFDVAVEAEGWDAVLGDSGAAGAKAAVREALDAAGLARPVELGIRFSDDAGVRDLNRAYRGRDAPTNVLSFALWEGGDADPRAPAAPEEPPLLLGDLVLALQTVLTEAKEQQKTPRDHTYHLLIHGALHLMGYDHQSEAEAERMESLETRLCGLFGIADPYTDPGSAVPNSGT